MFTNDLLKGRRVLITGGGTGLGLSMAQRIAGLGAVPIIVGRRRDVLEKAAAEITYAGGTVEWRTLDIRDPEAVEETVAAIWQEGPLDALINNAAGNFLARTETLSHRAVDAVVNTVLHGTAYVTLACGRRWIEAGRAGNVISIVTTYAWTGTAYVTLACGRRWIEAGRAGNVISIVTTYAWTGSGYVVPSVMGKAAVLAMTRSLAVEWGPKGIRLNAIAPGPFPTEGAWERLVPNEELAKAWEKRIPLGRTGRHEELTALVAFLLADQSAYINGDVITIDGGEWLQGAGQFNFAAELTDEDWDAVRGG